MLGTDPNIPVEIKYLSLGLETCPNLRCHNKKKGVEGTTPNTAEKAKNGGAIAKFLQKRELANSTVLPNPLTP